MTMSETKRYPLNQSPLYRLRRRKDLADLLGNSLDELESFANASPPAYKCFDKLVKNKHRWIEWPKKPLQRIQKRLSRLLDRIEPPDYIQSGFRERSYIKNAKRHLCTQNVAKIDIRKFFPSASDRYVRCCFLDVFQCSPDVAAILTKLLTVFGHLPTGGNSSTIVSFYAYRPMFDAIKSLADARGLTMTCCVDDMTFSGEAATSSFLNDVRMVVTRYGLRTHKVHWFVRQEPKVITGVALTPQGYRLPNVRRKALDTASKAFDKESDLGKKVKLGEKLLGRATEAAQVEDRFRPIMFLAATKLNRARKAVAAANAVRVPA
jgi:hypothetical protein